MHVIGEIDGRNCVIMDDMIDTAGTLVKAAEVLKERGAKKVYAYCTHPIFSGPAIERIAKGSALDEVVVTNTIPLSDSARGCTQDPPAVRGTADRRDDPAHRQGRVGDEFVLGPGKPVLRTDRAARASRQRRPFLKPESHWSRWLPHGASYEIRRF